MPEVPPAERHGEDAEHEAKRIRDTAIGPRERETLRSTPKREYGEPASRHCWRSGVSTDPMIRLAVRGYSYSASGPGDGFAFLSQRAYGTGVPAGRALSAL